MRTLTFPALVLGFSLLLADSRAQQPTPAMMVIQAANAPGTASAPTANRAAATTADANAASLEAAIKSLQETKAANVEMLKKQEEMLQKLDDLQKAAEQLKIFAHRG
jgi:hypothetical protein